MRNVLLLIKANDKIKTKYESSSMASKELRVLHADKVNYV